MTNVPLIPRNLLRTGACVTLTVSGGLITQACSDTASDAAYSPWRLWIDSAVRGTPMALAAAAILAANPHDSQPWLVDAFQDRDDGLPDRNELCAALGVRQP